MPLTSPRLWIVATPLGNPGDFSPRAREILSGVDLVLAEDTRRAGLLFQRLGVEAGRVHSFFEHNEVGKVKGVVELLKEGKDVALISDAGTPLISDPGYVLVRACREQGIDVSPVPGPSASQAALMASGLPPYPHVFLGFLPRKTGEITKVFSEYGSTKATLVFFERKSRLLDTLQLAGKILGNREFCIARELTKTHEEFIMGRLNALDAIDPDLKGEITVVLGPPDKSDVADEEHVLELIEEEREAGGTPKAVARRVKERTHGWSTKAVYELISKSKNK